MDSGLIFSFVPQMAGGGLLIAFFLRLAIVKSRLIATLVGALVPPLLELAPLLWENDTAPPLTRGIAIDLIILSAIGFAIAVVGALCGTLLAIRTREMAARTRR